MALVSFASVYIATKDSERQKMEKAEANLAQPFVIPKHQLLANPEETYPLLLETARKFGVNVFRTRVHYLTEDQVEIQKYILLTGDTRFFDAFSLKSGRFLTPEDMQGTHFLSTRDTGDPDQVGVIKSFGESIYLTIRPLKTSYDYLPVAGQYYVEASDSVTYDKFLEDLAQNINNYFKNTYTFTADDFKGVPGGGNEQELASDVADYLNRVNIIVFIIVLVLFLYYIFNESKQIGIMKMHGISNLKLWYLLVGRLILLSFIPLALLSLLAAFLVKNTTLPFVFNVFFSLSRNFVLLLAVAFLTYFYFKYINVKDVIKDKKDTRAIFSLNLLLKIAFSVLLILASVATLQDYRLVRIKQENLKYWEYAKDYGVFFPITIYETFQSDQEYRDYERKLDQALDKLYYILNRQGALLINARSYEEQNLILNKNYPGIRYILVNPNYLRVFPIYDKDGRAVEIPEDTRDLVLLVPEKYREKEREIVNFFADLGCGRGIPNPEGTVPEREQQSIRIIWLKNNQEVFSFNPDVFPKENNLINDPIIQVVTEQNSTFCDRHSILGGGATDPLKVKLIDRDPKRTYELLKPHLIQLGLESNLQHLVTVYQVFLDQIYNTQREMEMITLLIIALLAVLVILVVQNLTIFFSKYQRRFIIERIFGIGFFRTYRVYFFMFAALWLLQLLLSAGIAKRFDQTLFLVVAVLAAVEFVGSLVALGIIERKNKIKVVKGGF